MFFVVYVLFLPTHVPKCTDYKLICLTLCFQLFGLIVYFCASSGSWTTDTKTNEEVCMFKLKSFGCHIGGVVGFTSVIGAAVFVGGEYYFENVPSVKSRKHYVLIDLGFSSKNIHILLGDFLSLLTPFSTLK